MDISVIIPAYNEEKNITPLFSEIKTVLDALGKSYEVIFVNDGSTDGTLGELKKLKQEAGKVKIIDLNRNFGQTSAIMAGVDQSKGSAIILMDADSQNDPADIPRLLAKLGEGFDLVSGWRRKRRDPFFLRVLPSKIANRLISSVLKTRLHDYGCTLKAYNRSVLEGVKLYGEMHRFIPAIASWKGAKITELEVNHRARKYGRTKYGINRVMRVTLDLFLMAFLSEYGTKPLRFFGGLGIMNGVCGILSFFAVIYMKMASGIDMTGNPLLILSVLFSLVGIQLVSIGFLGEINIRTYYESQDKKTYHIREIIA